MKIGTDRHSTNRLKRNFAGDWAKAVPGQEIRVLGRLLLVDSASLTYEAGPRHCDLLMSSLNLSSSNSSATPGIKPHDRDYLAITKMNSKHRCQITQILMVRSPLYVQNIMDPSAVHNRFNQSAIISNQSAVHSDQSAVHSHQNQLRHGMTKAQSSQ